MLSKQSRNLMSMASYLDVSQYIIKEPSPLLKPTPPQNYHQDVIHFSHLIQSLFSLWFVSFISRSNHQLLSNCIIYLYVFKFIQILAPEDFFELESIKGSPAQVELTPVTSGLIRMEVQEIMDDFMLEGQECPEDSELLEGKRRRNERMKMKKSQSYDIFRIENQLDKIIEYAHQQSDISELDQSYNDSYFKIEEEHCGLNSNTFFTSWSKKNDSRDTAPKDIQLENQTTIDASIVDYRQNIQNFSRNPKQQILSKIKEIEGMKHETEEGEKKSLLKQFLQGYLLDYQQFCFQQAWKDISPHDFSLLKKGIQETFHKKFGSLPFECRRVKLLKYLQKKKKRIWRKKVSYDCRKKVADGRLRIKGKFVTRQQACQQLGLESLDGYNAQEIKDMLQKRMDDGLRQLI